MQTMTQVTASSIRDAFNDALDFALDELTDPNEAVEFLKMWREGCWPEIEKEYPEWTNRSRG